jgi:hypothetical protein
MDTDTDIDINGDKDDQQNHSSVFEIGSRVEKVMGVNLGSKGNVIKVDGDKVKVRFDDIGLECKMQYKSAFVLLREAVEEDWDNISSLWEIISQYLDINIDNLKKGIYPTYNDDK